MKARGQGRLYRRGEVWWIQYFHRGTIYRESSNSKVRRVAGDLLKKRLGTMGKGEFTGVLVERTTFEDLAAMILNDYEINGRKSIGRLKQSLGHLREAFEHWRAIDITHDRLLAYASDRLKHAKPATVRNELAALKRMFRLGTKAGKVTHRPEFPTITVSNARTGFFEEAELQAVLGELADHLQPLVQFLALTGWRASEAKGLRWAQVDHVGGVVRLEVGTTKTGAGRVFPFAAHPALAALIRAQREHTSALERERGVICPHVFHRNGKPIQSFHNAWREACKRAGVPGRLVHDLRRTAARNLVRSGVAEHTAMMLMGHRTRSVFDRYSIVNESDLAAGVRKLAAFEPAAESRRVVPLHPHSDPRTSTEEAQFGGSRDVAEQ